jgi:Glycosyltransferase family 87
MPARINARRLSAWGAVVLLSAFWCVLAPPLIRAAWHDDFLSRYIGARLAWSGDFHHMYDPAVQWSVQQQVLPEEPILSVSPRPPFFAALTAPLSALSYREAFIVWFALQIALLGICVLWAWRKFGDDALVWAALSGPTFFGIACGQETSLLLALALAGYVLAGRGQERAAGAVWGLMLFKFNLVLVFPLAMLATRRWRMLQGFSITGCCLGLFSVLVLGSNGVRLYLKLLSSSSAIPKLDPSPALMINLQSLAAHLSLNSAAFLAPAIIVVLAVGWMALRQAPLWRWLSVVLVVSLLVAPHVYAYNGALLLLPTWLVMFLSPFRWTKIAAAVYTLPPLFLLRLFGEYGSIITPLCLLGLLAAFVAESASGAGLRPANVREPCEALTGP